MIVVAIIAILAAIAIPQVSAHRTRSYNTTAASDLKNAAIAQEAYHADNQRYSSIIDVLKSDPYNLSTSEYVVVQVTSATNLAYIMTARHSKGNITYTLPGPGGTINP